MSELIHAGKAKAIAADANLKGITIKRTEILKQILEEAKCGNTYAHADILNAEDVKFFENLGYQVDPGGGLRLFVPREFDIRILPPLHSPILEIEGWQTPTENFMDFSRISWK